MEMNCQHTPDVLLDCLANQAVLYPLPFRKVSGLEPAAVSRSFSSQRSPLPEETPSMCLGNAQDPGSQWCVLVFVSVSVCVCGPGQRDAGQNGDNASNPSGQVLALRIFRVDFWLLLAI